MAKQIVAQAKIPNIYYWHSPKNFEVDILIEQGNILKALEIKSSSTFTREFLGQLKKWQQIYKDEGTLLSYVVYSGTETFVSGEITVLSYKDLSKLD